MPPKPKSSPAPAWPTAKPEAHDVVVPVILVVGADGRVVGVEVEASVGPAFDRAAVETAKTWTFEPAVRDGQPVAARIRSMVRFAGVTEPAAAVVTPAVAAPALAPAPVAERVETVRVSGSSPPHGASDVVRGREIVTAAPTVRAATC